MKEKHDAKTEEFLNKLSNVKLSEEKRAAVWRELEAVRAYHPAPDDVRDTDAVRSTTATSGLTWWAYFKNVNQTYSRTMKTSLLIALMVVAGGGTSMAAQNALPGDPLYGMKLHVNEEVRSALAFSTDAEARLQAELLKERVREAAALEAEGKLTGETESAVNARIAAQTDTATRLAAASDAEASTKLNADISSTLAFLSSLKGSLDPRVAARMKADGGFGGGTTESSALATRDEVSNEAAMATDQSYGTSMLAADIDLETQLKQGFARHENLELVVDQTTALQADLRAEFRALLAEAEASLTAAQTALRAGNETTTRTNLEASAETMGSIESEFSLLGKITIDPTTGFITDVTIGSSSTGTVSNFRECVEAGNPVMESYPEQCRADGKTFVNEAQLDLEVGESVESLPPTSLEGGVESSGEINLGL